MSREKQCGACRKTKPVGEFNKNSTKFGGLQDKCKKCTKEYYDRWRKKNPEYHAKRYKEQSSTEEGRALFRMRSREQYKKNKKS